MADGDLFDERVTAGSTNVIFQQSSTDEDFQEDYTKVPQWWDNQEDIVISGLSGRYPESSNVKEFMENLYAGVDMVTEDNRRWDPGYYGLPKGTGKIKDLTKFDDEFFGFTPKQANNTDPQVRILLETAYECMFDAGVNPFKLRGTKTGVFLGNQTTETATINIRNLEQIHGEALNGYMPLIAYHLIYHLDFKGPCMTVDAACSSSLLALQLAIDSIRAGQCDQAIVASSHLTLIPNANLGYMALGMLSPNSRCHSFDVAGDGYVRSEFVGCILLQKISTARRVYATILHAKSNTDGFKEQGISFPSVDQQIKLLRSTYKEAGLDPQEISYVEAHGTGTKVGDPIECHAIKTVFAKNRQQPLLIGSVKSNAGHAEPGSGILGISKVIIAMENGVIPQNLHFHQANPYIPSLLDGSLKVVNKNTKWQPGLVGLSSFGFGGSNTHVILKPNPISEKTLHFDTNKKDLPILLIHSNRTHVALENIFDMFENENSDNLYLYNLLCEHSASPVNLLPYRGYTIVNHQDPKKKPIRKIVKVMEKSKPQIWFAYSGIGSQWVGMGRELLIFDVFHESILKCSAVAEQFGISPRNLIAEGMEEDFKNPLICLTCIITIQIALTDLIRYVGIKEDGIVGHSIGEIAASYADGCTDYKETMLIAYFVGKIILDNKLTQGGMASVYLPLEKILKRLPDGIFSAIKNHSHSVTIAGDSGKIAYLVGQLETEGHIVKPINSAGVAFHSPYLQNISEQMRNALLRVLPHPNHRSEKWIASGIRNVKLESYASQYSSAEFHVNNLVSMMDFDSALKRVPTNAIIIEISPDCVIQDILKRGLVSGSKNVGLMSRHTNNVDFFLMSLGTIYQYGADFEIQNLYPKVQYPVPRGTPMLSHMLGWKHDRNWKVCTGAVSEHLNCVRSFTFDPFPADSKDHYILHHVFDGRPLFPFCGHIFMAWKTICKFKLRDFNKTPVVFENIKVIRATFVTKPVKFDVLVTLANGDFEITEDGNLCASGRITILDEEQNKQPFQLENLRNSSKQMNQTNDNIELTSEDIYKEFLLRGYEYGPAFRGIQNASNSGQDSSLLWTGNWVTFIDSLFQTFFVMEKSDTFIVPVGLRHLRIDPLQHLTAVHEIGGTKVISARSCLETVGFIAGGVEACGFLSQTVRRRLHQQKITLQRSCFVPLKQDHCMCEYPETQKQLHIYNDACRSVAVGVIKNLAKSGTHIPNRAMYEKIALQVNVPAITESANKATEKECSLLKLLNGLHQYSMSLNGLKNAENLSALIKSSLAHLEYDKVWNFGWSDRSVLDQMEIPISNTTEQLIKIAVIAPNNLLATKKLHWAANFHPLVDAKFLLIGPDIEKRFTTDEKAGLNVTFHSFDTNSEKEIQGIEKNQDIVVLDRLLHQKTDIQKYLASIKNFLRDDGFVLVNEITGNYEAAFLIEGLQRELPSFPINGIRKYGLFYEHSDWCEIFEKSGFYLIGWSTEQLMTTLYTLKKIPSYAVDPVYLKVDNDNEFKWIDPLQQAIEDRLNEPPGKTIVMVSNEMKDSGVIGVGKHFKDEYKNNKTRTLINASLKNRKGLSVLDLNDPNLQKMLKQDLLVNIYRDEVFGNFNKIPIQEGQLHVLEETEHTYLNNLIPGDLTSLTWVSSSNKYFADQPHNELLSMSAVYYAALNFRDVLVATGRLPLEVIPKTDRLDFDALLGLEFCGRDVKTGKRVMGLANTAQGLATTLITDSRFTFDVPNEWSMEEAATIPLAYSTAFYSLLVRGKMRHGEKVLIHSGSGAVGIASITIALAYGCEVFTTVGNDKKKNFLLDRFPRLDAKHICSSQTSEFELHIMQITAGQGVDIVLNSLSNEKLLASVRCLAQNGRFLEIGKSDLAANSNLGMSAFLKNISFHGILMDSLASPVLQPEWLDAIAMLADHIKRGIVKPLPSTIFEMNQHEEAFRYMTQRKHIGKVMLKIRSEEKELIALPKPVIVKAVKRSTCHPQHVYIILGGLQGFSLELANWLFGRGCRKMIITSRNKIQTGYQARCVNAWKKAGAICNIIQGDLSDKGSVQKLLNEAQCIGPIGGIFNVTAVSEKDVHQTSTVNCFQTTFAQIFRVMQNVDELTRLLCGSELKWFVLISSLNPSLDNTSRAAYAYSISAAERIIEQRRSDGLSGNVVHYGAIGDLGINIDSQDDNNSLTKGILPQRMGSCLQIMDSILCLNHPVVYSFVKSEVESQKIVQSEDVGETIARILGISDLLTINPHLNLGDLGLDSLMAIEIGQTLERDFGLILTLKDLRSTSLTKLRDLAKVSKPDRVKSVKVLTPVENAAGNDHSSHISTGPTTPCIVEGDWKFES